MVSVFRIPSVESNLSQQQHQLHRPSPFACIYLFSLLWPHRASLSGHTHTACLSTNQSLFCFSANYYCIFKNPNFCSVRIVYRRFFQKDARSQKRKIFRRPRYPHNHNPPNIPASGTHSTHSCLSAATTKGSCSLFGTSASWTPRVFTLTDTPPHPPNNTLHCRSFGSCLAAIPPISNPAQALSIFQNASWSIRRVCHQQPQAQAQPQIKKPTVPAFWPPKNQTMSHYQAAIMAQRGGHASRLWWLPHTRTRHSSATNPPSFVFDDF